jgi:hypothetical protein
MSQSKCYENYPSWIIFASNFVSIAIYLIGAFIMTKISLIFLGLYLLYILFLELRVMSKSCVNCYYYGKYCAFGKGKISSLIFKKGEPKKFLCRKITWKDIIPDFLVSIIPVVAGIVLLIINFNMLILLLVILLAILTTVGNSLIRGNLACKYCKQRELGCPAQKLFNNKK